MIAGVRYYDICRCFLLYSFLGWVAEVAFHGFRLGKIVNRGFLNGPVCPVYGFAMVLILLSSRAIPLDESGRMNPWMAFLYGIVFATAVELLGGWMLDKLFHARWWDYSHLPLNFHGYICLRFSLLWGGAVVLVVEFLQPWLASLPSDSLISESAGWRIMLVLYILYFIDLLVTVFTLAGLNRQLAQLDALRRSLRTVSDAMSETIGSTAIKTGEKLEEGKEKLAQGMDQLQDDLVSAQLQGTLDASLRKKDLQARYNSLREKVLSRPLAAVRILSAFPTLSHHDYPEVLADLRSRLKEKKQRH